MASTKAEDSDSEHVDDKWKRKMSTVQNTKQRTACMTTSTPPIDVNDKDSLKRRALQSQDASKKRKSFVKKFRREWMDEPIFRGWLEPVQGTTEKCWCSVCKVILLCGHSELEKHASGKKHSDLLMLKILKGDIDSNDGLDIALEEVTLPEHGKDDSVDSTDLAMSRVVALAQDSSNQQVVLLTDMKCDGTLRQVSMEELEALQREQEASQAAQTKSSSILNIGSTTITKGQKKTIPIVLRQKAPVGTVMVQKGGSSNSKLTEVRGAKEEKLKKWQDLTDYKQIAEMSTDEDEDYWDMEDQHPLVREEQNKTITTTGKAVFEDGSRRKYQKELEMRIELLNERRRQRSNLYRLKLDEMDAKVRAAEAELVRGEELHKLKIQHLELQILNEKRKTSSDVT